jgi:hypothetical protein
MVTYNYSISPNNSTTIQQVITSIVQELSENPTIEHDIEVIISDGTYAGFTIPNSGLFPLISSQYRLVIKSGGDFFPIIDFNASSETQLVGIDVGSGNPNVTIKGLRIQYFAVGVRVGLNSHFPIVQNCIINNNRNVGIFFEQADESQALQNIIINGDYGIVCRLTKSAACVHNTIFQNGAISTIPGKSISCIWAELANDYGQGLTDTGILHLIGNVGWNTSGRCLTLFANNIEAQGSLVSNYNDWVVGDPQDFISIEDNAFLQGPNAQPRQVVTTLAEWKIIGFDSNSISQDPKFIAPLRIRTERNGFAIDLNLLPISPVLGKVPSFAYDLGSALSWLPSYVDSQAFARDLLRANRSQNGTAIGANDTVSTAGFFGQDIFSNPLDLGIAKDCGVDPFSNILYKKLELWFPKINKGYFYSNEREYYLYARKETATLGELAVTEIYLPGILAVDRDIKVKVAGKEISSNYYDVLRDKFMLYHRELPIRFRDEEVEIEGEIATWQGDRFFYRDALYRSKIQDGETKYYLPKYAINSGPTVVTDDTSYFTDSDYTSNREYSVEFNKGYSLSEIKFANSSNLLLNPQFDYGLRSWDSDKCSVAVVSTSQFSVAGGSIAFLENKGYIQKTLSSSDVDEFSFSFHARSQGSGDLSWKIEPLNSSFNQLGIVFTGSLELVDNWARYAILFNSTGTDFILDTPDKPFKCSLLTGYDLPETTAYVDIKLAHIHSPAYPDNLELDAIQYEATNNPTLYHKPPTLFDMTVEYETSNADYFIDSNLAMSPISNLLSDGFIYIPELSAASYGGPSHPSITTLHEWRWPEGRKNVLPWARTKGKDKLRKRPKNRFNALPEVKPEIISPVYAYAAAKDIKILPSIPKVTVGDNTGVGISIRVIDTDEDIMALGSVTASIIDYNLRYPGVLHKTLYGLKQQLGTVVQGITDTLGAVPVVWIPPSEPAGLYRGPIPAPRLKSASGESISVIRTEYPVSLEGFGNIIILNNKGEIVETSPSEPITEVHTPALTSADSKVSLAYPAKLGSVKVVVDGVKYSEVQINLLNSNQFFVDYDSAVIIIKGRTSSVKVDYLPKYVFVNSSDPYKIMIYKDKVFEDYDNAITLGYDLSIVLNVKVDNPGLQSTLEKEFELVAQNPLTKSANTLNKLSLEI